MYIFRVSLRRVEWRAGTIFVWSLWWGGWRDCTDFLSLWLCSGGYGTAEMVKGVVRVFLAYSSLLPVLLADGHW